MKGLKRPTLTNDLQEIWSGGRFCGVRAVRITRSTTQKKNSIINPRHTAEPNASSMPNRKYIISSIILSFKEFVCGDGGTLTLFAISLTKTMTCYASIVFALQNTSVLIFPPRERLSLPTPLCSIPVNLHDGKNPSRFTRGVFASHMGD